MEEDLATERVANANFEAYDRRGAMRDGRRMSARPKAHTPPGNINLTEPDSRFVHGMRGWLQSYNAQALCNEQPLILAAEVMTASPDFGHLGHATVGQLAASCITHRSGLVPGPSGENG